VQDILRDAALIDRPYLKPVHFEAGQPLNHDAVAAIAVAANPDLRALRARAGVADAQVFAAGLLPDPTFSAGFDAILRGPDTAANLAGGLGFSLAAIRSRGAVLARAKASARQTRLDLAWAEWQTAGLARIQAVRVTALGQITELARETRDANTAMLDRMLGAAARGDISPDQVQAARLAALDANDRLRISERDLAAAQIELTRLLGLAPTTALQLALPRFKAPDVDAPRLTLTAESDRFDLAALRSGYDAQEASVRKAILDQFPTLDLTLNATRDPTFNTLLGPGIAFTLPLWNRNRGGIAIEQSTRAALKSEYEARVARMRSDIAGAAAAIAVDLRQRADLQRGLPAVERLVTVTSTAEARGDIAPAIAAAARQVLRDRRTQQIQIEQDITEKRIGLELLSGRLEEAWPG
jgi:outer membrane protein TolC